MSTTPTTYNPREGSLADRVLAFFTQQPDEELSIEDIVPKFDAKVQSVKMCLKPSVQAGLIRWGQNDKDEPNAKTIATGAYQLADAMLKARQEGGAA